MAALLPCNLRLGSLHIKQVFTLDKTLTIHFEISANKYIQDSGVGGKVSKYG